MLFTGKQKFLVLSGCDGLFAKYYNVTRIFSDLATSQVEHFLVH